MHAYFLQTSYLLCFCSSKKKDCSILVFWNLVSIPVFFLEVRQPFPYAQCQSGYAITLPLEVDTLCCVVFLCRHIFHWAADQPCGGDRGHSHGSAVWIWCSQCSLHIHGLFCQVRPVTRGFRRELNALHAHHPCRIIGSLDRSSVSQLQTACIL